MRRNQFHYGIAALLALSSIVACKKQETQPSPADVVMGKSTFSSQKSNIHFYALDNNNTLVKYSGVQTFREETNISITGLQADEKILGLDFRPATKQLYGVSNQSRIYVINENTGYATAVSPTPFSPAINGSEVGFDFNPTVDRIRLVHPLSSTFRGPAIAGL